MENSVLCWLDITAKKYTDKIVFWDADSSLTFEKFNTYTKAVGTFLADKIAQQNPVIVMSGRHALTPACFLGVARAGGFYAPMDAAMPVHRLNQIIDVIKADIMVVDKKHLDTAKSLEFNGEIVVLEDILNTEIDEQKLLSARENLTEYSPLYTIFTSGSTGVPKGVITSHHSLMCYINAVSKVLELDDSDVLGNQSPLDYIAAVRDIYLPLKTGASTVIIPKNEFAMPTQLFETLNEYKVTTLCWSVAGIELPAKLGAFEIIKPEHLKRVIFSGSVMPCKYLKIWQQNLPDVKFINQYGPTEVTASCTYYVVDELVDDDTVLPIGKPYDNYRIILLKEDGTQAKNGEIGEICVSGPCVTLGYYGAKEKTDEMFVQNPLNTNYREIIYKTGDLGHFDENGILYFHGRKDRQIKHMGHRIELNEIEEIAKQIKGITECCSLYYKEKEHLYLFYTGNATSKEIVLYFRSKMPAFMVPRKLINLDSMPTLPNGKIDMQSLKTYMK